MRLTIVGNVFGTSGYAVHTRKLAIALHELGHEIRIESPKPQGWERQVSDSLLIMLNRSPMFDSPALVINTPPSWDFTWSEGYPKVYGYCVWEGDKVPVGFIDNLISDKYDAVFVPSTHVYDAVVNTVGELKHLYVVPEGFDPSKFFPEVVDKELPFTFVVNKGWTGGWDDRGGVQYALQAFSEEFSRDEPVRMIMKINGAYLNIFPNQRLQWFHHEVNKLNISTDRPNIQVTLDDMTEDQLRKMYCESDVYLNLCRAEGFGLPGLEAKACGCKSLVSEFGGHLDYCTADDSLVEGTLSLVSHDFMYEGISWFTPDIKSVRAQMRALYEAGRLSWDERIVIAEQVVGWTWRDSAQKLLSHIDC